MRSSQCSPPFSPRSGGPGLCEPHSPPGLGKDCSGGYASGGGVFGLQTGRQVSWCWRGGSKRRLLLTRVFHFWEILHFWLILDSGRRYLSVITPEDRGCVLHKEGEANGGWQSLEWKEAPYPYQIHKTWLLLPSESGRPRGLPSTSFRFPEMLPNKLLALGPNHFPTFSEIFWSLEIHQFLQQQDTLTMNLLAYTLIHYGCNVGFMLTTLANCENMIPKTDVIGEEAQDLGSRSWHVSLYPPLNS
jgi:hypothetical protein